MNKRAVVLVHGFGSSPETWDTLLKLFQNDPALSGFDFDRSFSYPTPWFSINPIRRIPRLRELGQALKAHLESTRMQAYEEITLVGHSQGGLIIQSYLAGMLADEQGASLRRIRQLIFIATPNLGSTFFSPLRSMLSHVLPNAQERTLRVLNEEIADLQREIERRILTAVLPTATEQPIPVTCFWGLSDRVVPEASAKGAFEVFTPLAGDHFTVLKPAGLEDENYKLLAEAILDPAGHRNVFEVEYFEMRLAVEPLAPPQEINCKYGDNQRKVVTDNVGHLRRVAKFSLHNRCTALFSMSYGTRNNGFISPSASFENEAPPDEKRAWTDYGVQANYQFTPQPGQSYTVHFDIYKGYDSGQRDAHFHLKRNRHYKKIHLELDLSAYLKAGWIVSVQPSLYFHPTDPENHDMCALRKLENPLDCLPAEKEGVYVWDCVDVRDGVIDLVWDVAQAAPQLAGQAV